MSIFDSPRTTRGSAEKHFLNSLVNGATPDMIIWKSPVEDFNTNSVLTVNPGEKALFYKNGQLIQVFGPGRYELNTENYPFLSDIRNWLSGGESTFRCQVYFIRTALSQEVLWGTDSPIQLRDPVQRIQTALIGRGAYKIRIENAPLFITKLAGFVDEFSTRNLDNFFYSQFLQTIKSCIAREVMNAKEEILGVITKVDELAARLKKDLAPVFASFGLTLEVFSIMGDDYRLIKSMGIMEDLANNQGAGGAGAEMGLGMAAFGMMGNWGQSVFGQGQYDPAQGIGGTQSVSGAQGKNAQTASTAENDPQAKLSKLKKLLDAGLISQADYDEAKKKVLADFLA